MVKAPTSTGVMIVLGDVVDGAVHLELQGPSADKAKYCR